MQNFEKQCESVSLGHDIILLGLYLN
uniref:Uncharacterized protein n=1 Tax=Arundo donax TaxID=35708 RepID=A0A0A8ZB46_ARUDO